MVTTGGRETSCSSVSGVSNRPSSTSDSATRLTVWPSSVGDQFGGVGVDHVGDLVHLALAHQQLDDVHAAFRHAVGEFLDRDRLGQHDFARQALLLLHDALEALGAAAEGRDGARALLAVAGGGAGDGQAAARFHFAAARRLDGGDGQLRLHRGAAQAERPGCSERTRRERPGFAGGGRGRRRRGGSRGTRRVEDDLLRAAGVAGRRQGQAVVGLGRTGSGARRRRGQAAARFVLGPALGFEITREAGLFFLLAGFGGVAFGAFAVFALAAGAGVGLLALAVFLFTDAGVVQRPGAGVALVIGQRAQDDAGLRARRGRLDRRPGGRAGGRRRARGGRRGPGGRRGCRPGGGRGRGRGRGGRRLRRFMGAALHLFDDDGLGAAMREALAHDALFDGALQRQRLARLHGQGLVAGIVRIVHIAHASQGSRPFEPSALKPCSKASFIVKSCPSRGASASPSPRYNASRRAEARKTFAAAPSPSAA